MAIKIYNPRTKLFSVMQTPDDAELPRTDVLLLNILLELQVQTLYMAASSPDNPSESPEMLRSFVVSENQ